VPCGNRQPVFAGGQIVPEFFHELEFFRRSEPFDLAGERGVHEGKLCGGSAFGNASAVSAAVNIPDGAPGGHALPLEQAGMGGVAWRCRVVSHCVSTSSFSKAIESATCRGTRCLRTSRRTESGSLRQRLMVSFQITGARWFGSLKRRRKNKGTRMSRSAVVRGAMAGRL
jgi:hypothetical protein